MFCGSCGTQIKEGAKFCPGCGWQVPDMAPDVVPAGKGGATAASAAKKTTAAAHTCRTCGKPLEPGWKACPFCGAEINGKPVCTGCGRELDPVWIVCPFCKTQIGRK
jgi:RNA polymerase subunit RPABC4/transcription elongation factor Spt4